MSGKDRRRRSSPQDPRDPVLARVQALIRQHGWAVLGVDAGGCDVPGCTTDHSQESGRDAFYYTAGLTEAGLPELLLRGQPMRVAHPLLNALARHSTTEELVPDHPYRLAAVAGTTVQVTRLDGSTTRTLCKVARVLFGARLQAGWEVRVL